MALVSLNRNDFALKNQGYGVAININYLGIKHGQRVLRSVQPMGVGDLRPIESFGGTDPIDYVFEVSYESLDGFTYKTTAKKIKGEADGFEVVFEPTGRARHRKTAAT